jgi:hypothetical protein
VDADVARAADAAAAADTDTAVVAAKAVAAVSNRVVVRCMMGWVLLGDNLTVFVERREAGRGITVRKLLITN